MGLTVRGPEEGQLTLVRTATKLTCVFTVALSPVEAEAAAEPLYVLYRLRVKEASIFFSRTYGLLGRPASLPDAAAAHTDCATGPGSSTTTTSPTFSTSETISLFAELGTVTTDKLSTIRVEYTHVSAEDAARIAQDAIPSKVVCRPFFQSSQARTYDVKCVMIDPPPPGEEERRGVTAEGSPAAGAGKDEEGQPSKPPRPVTPSLTLMAVAVAISVVAAVGISLCVGRGVIPFKRLTTKRSTR